MQLHINSGKNTFQQNYTIVLKGLTHTTNRDDIGFGGVIMAKILNVGIKEFKERISNKKIIIKSVECAVK